MPPNCTCIGRAGELAGELAAAIAATISRSLRVRLSGVFR